MMSMRKYQSVEKTEILPRSEQDRVSSELHKLGKTSARDLTDEERAKVLLDVRREI